MISVLGGILASLADPTRSVLSMTTDDCRAVLTCTSGIHFSKKGHASRPSAPFARLTSRRLFSRDLVSKSKSLSSSVLFCDSSVCTLAYKSTTSSSALDIRISACDIRSVQSLISFFIFSITFKTASNLDKLLFHRA